MANDTIDERVPLVRARGGGPTPSRHAAAPTRQPVEADPRPSTPPAAAKGMTLSLALRSSSELVLLVEDEVTVRTLISRVLAREGYDVLVASNGEEALAAIERDGRNIDLMVTDVMMPVLSGPELAARVLQLRPRTKVLLVSGHTESKVMTDGVPAGTAFLQKPFTPVALLGKVREMLDASHAGGPDESLEGGGATGL